MVKTTIVIPSNRNIDSLKEWSETDLKNYPIILIEDSQEKTIKHVEGFDIQHFSWKDIEEDLKEKSWIISRGDSSIKSYGLLKAFQQGAENIICLDDDVVSNHPQFVKTHIDILNARVLSGNNGILNMVRKQGVFPKVPQKGLPKFHEIEKPVVFSYGLWYGYLDVPSQHINDFGMVSGNNPNSIEEEIHDGLWASISGMNVALKAEAIPAYYQLLMGKEHGLGKWGDTWSGLFMQKIIHHLNRSILVGHPMVFHKHYGSAQDNLELENAGIELNELLWRDIPKTELYGKTFRASYVELANKLPLYPGMEAYMEKLKKAMLVWADFF